MARLPETTQDWLDRYEKKRLRAFDNYQSSGEARYDRQELEYSIICDALRAKLDAEHERGEEIKRRMNNKTAVVDRLGKDEYTRAEVIELLNNAVWW